MSARLVRCPFCGKRFNLSGFPAGARLKCGSCAAVLVVPRTQRFQRLPGQIRRTVLQIGAAVLVSMGCASLLYVFLRPVASTVPSTLPTVAAPAGEIPREEVRKGTPDPVFLDFNDRLTQAKLKLREEFGSEQIRFRDDFRPFLVAVEKSMRYPVDSVIKEYGERLVELYTFFRREFGPSIELPELDEVLPVVVLSCRDSFDAYTRRVNNGEDHSTQIRGVYELSRQRVILYHDPVAPFEVILHEGVHQLMHSYIRRLGGDETTCTTQWFWEGLATYFEGFRRSGDGQIFLDPAVNRSRLPAMKHAISGPDRTYAPLALLTGMSRDGFWTWYREQCKVDDLQATRKAQAFYAESWALVYFLRTKGGPYLRTFDEYFRDELQGKGGKESFEGAIRKHLGVDLGQLEQEFLQYVRTLD